MMKRAKLTEICNPKQWKTIPTSELLEDGFPVYGANGIIGFYSEYNHDDPVVAITCRGATCGTVNITCPKAYVTGNAMCLDDVRSDVSIEYLYYNLLHYDFKKVISGSAQPQITRQGLQKVEIPLCSLEEQSEIVRILQKTELIIESRQRELQSLDELIKARFVEMFSGVNYPQVTISDLVEKKVSSAKKDFSPDEIIKYIDISSIDNKRNLMTGYTEYVFAEAPSRAQQHVKKGDILISTVRPNLRNVALTSYEDDNLVASSGFCILRAKKCLPSYLMAIACSNEFTDAMSKVVTGANYPAIKDSDVMGYTVTLPPIELQMEFERFTAQIDKSKVAIQKSLDETQMLFDSLMQQYFG